MGGLNTAELEWLENMVVGRKLMGPLGHGDSPAGRI